MIYNFDHTYIFDRRKYNKKNDAKFVHVYKSQDRLVHPLVQSLIHTIY